MASPETTSTIGTVALTAVVSSSVVSAVVAGLISRFNNKAQAKEQERQNTELQSLRAKHEGELTRLRAQIARSSSVAQTLDRLEVDAMVAVWRQVCRLASAYIVLLEPFESVQKGIEEVVRKPGDRMVVVEDAKTLFQMVMENRIHLDEAIADGCGALVTLVITTSTLSTEKAEAGQLAFETRERLKRKSVADAERLWRELRARFREKLNKLAERN